MMAKLLTSLVVTIVLSGCGSSDAGVSNEDGSEPNTHLQYQDITLDPDRSVSNEERESINLFNSWFPSSSAVAPIIRNGSLPGWQDISTPSFKRFVFSNEAVPLLTDPHFFQFSFQAADYNNSLIELLDAVQTATLLENVTVNRLVEIESWRAIFGQTLNAGYSQSEILDEDIVWFIDTLGPDPSDIATRGGWPVVVAGDQWFGRLQQRMLGAHRLRRSSAAVYRRPADLGRRHLRLAHHEHLRRQQQRTRRRRRTVLDPRG